MHSKTLLVAMFVLAGLALASTGGLIVGAWHVPDGGMTTQLSSTTVVVGQGVYDTASVTGAGVTPNPPSTYVTGTVVFKVYSGADCTGSPLAWSPGVYSDSVTISTGVSNPGLFKSDTFSTTGLSAGSYSFTASYVSGNYYTGSSNDQAPCEPFTLMPTTGVPEFGVAGMLGMVLVFAIAIPLLIATRKLRTPIRMP